LAKKNVIVDAFSIFFWKNTTIDSNFIVIFFEKPPLNYLCISVVFLGGKTPFANIPLFGEKHDFGRGNHHSLIVLIS
jgi:hypothetical protein